MYISVIFSIKDTFVQSKCSGLNCVFNTSKLIFMRCVGSELSVSKMKYLLLVALLVENSLGEACNS